MIGAIRTSLQVSIQDREIWCRDDKGSAVLVHMDEVR
jgi:hypothetical protein